eukprot:TRINITY_DN2234_c0_g2_i1.p1 TRINITY_DN2234_c0_g2~~TRINITY_DN2234_c0_g2_i1.p1  ORF type:complete len:229 (+),score=52.77 TRINITY_DN2234_c0_g2_i1:43-729(+)
MGNASGRHDEAAARGCAMESSEAHPACVASLLGDYRSAYQGGVYVHEADRAEWCATAPVMTKLDEELEASPLDASFESFQDDSFCSISSMSDEDNNDADGCSAQTPVVDTLAPVPSLESPVCVVLRSFPEYEDPYTHTPQRRVTFASIVDEADEDAPSPQFNCDNDSLHNAHISAVLAPAHDDPVPEHAVPVSLAVFSRGLLEEAVTYYVYVAPPACPLRSCVSGGCL